MTQFQELRLEMLKRPEMSYRELRDLVWARFHVQYSRKRLRHLLKAKLGIEWKPARSDAETAKPAPRKRVAEPLKLAVRQGAPTHTKNRRGRPRKLSAAQLKELRDYVLERPETSFWRLHRLVWNRFHVRHSHASLKRLLMTEFGITWTGASRKLGEGLNLAELQQALATAADWRMKKRLKALIQLGKGGNARRVAHANQVNLETLRNWAKRYRTQRRA